MSSRFLSATAGAAIALSASFASAATVEGYSSLFVFGDSLSDPGNLFAATGGSTPADPPYFNGRFSNGPVWAEGLTAEFAAQGLASANFAVGGARAIENGDFIPDLASQLATFTAAVPAAFYGDTPLAALWFGANDLLGAIGFVDTAAVEAVAIAAAQAVGAAAKSLYDNGIADFVIFNLPDFGSLPAYAAFAPGLVGDATAGSDAFNAELDTQIDQLRLMGLNVTEIGIDALFQALLADPTEFGVTNTSTPCVIPAVYVCSAAELSQLAFFDAVHPTAVIHAAVQDVVRNAIAPIPVPMPAGMLAMALLALGGLARRRCGKTSAI